MARIVVTTSTGDETIDLAPGTVLTVGRDAANRLPLPDEAGLSRRHCRIGPREGGEAGWEVADLGSTNKTRVDGAVIQQRALTDGDVIEIGSVKIRFEDPEEAARLKNLMKEGICFLEWISGDRKGERVMLTDPRTRMGRRETNTVVLDDRMVSGHHVEIDRDVNGYTIRDLGSTNGTLVNGDPVSEALLTHGSRVRIGNCRFAFKDPSMKDVEVELAHFEEDEGWGMMGEIDLSRARGSKTGLALVLLLLVGAAGGMYLLSQQQSEGGGPDVARGGQIENGDFDDPDLPWTTSREGIEPVRIPTGGSPQPGPYMSVENGGESPPPLRVLSDQPIDTFAGRPLRVRAHVVRESDPAVDFVVIWASNPTIEEQRAGMLVLQRTDVLKSPGGVWGLVDVECKPPAWAKSVRLGLWLEPGAIAGLDSVDVHGVLAAPQRTSVEVPSYGKRAYLDDTGSLDLLASETVLVTGARPFVRLPGGEILTRFTATNPVAADASSLSLEGAFQGPEGEVPASIRWTATKEGIRYEVTSPGAEAVGLLAAAPAQHVGGTVSILGEFPPQRVPARVASKPLDKVSRTLVGDASPAEGSFPSLVAFVQADEKPLATLEFVPSRDPGLVYFRHTVSGASAVIDLVTDFSQQRERAKSDLASAVALQRSAPGRAIRALRDVAQAYPFEEGIRDEALQLAADLETKARNDILALAAAVSDYRVYRSADALATMEERAAGLIAQFPEGDEQAGSLETDVSALAAQARELRREHEITAATPGVDRLEKLAGLLQDMKGYRPLAAVYSRAILDRYGHLEGEAEDIARRLDGTRKRLKKLLAHEDVKEVLPPVPVKDR